MSNDTNSEDEATVDARMQVIIGLIPPSTPLFRKTYTDRSVALCSSDDADSDDGDTEKDDSEVEHLPLGDSLYWRPASCGYVSAYNPLWAGLYAAGDYYRPWAPAESRLNDHSFTVEAAEVLRGGSVPDGCLAALLVDEVLRLRALLANGVSRNADDLGAGIRAARRRSGISQGELAERAGITQHYLSMLENGRREPSLSLLRTMGREIGFIFAIGADS